MDIAAWLRSLGLERYEEAFRDNAIDEWVLSELQESDLEKLGVLLGHRKKLLKSISALSGKTASAGALEAGLSATMASAEAVKPPWEVLKAQAERRQLTVMFVDLVGSTALASRLDPEELRDVIRAYQNTVAGEVVRLEGVVAKFMGDGVLAYFGWPRAHENEAERAVKAGLAVVEAVGQLRAPSGEAVSARVGIATGLVVVGDLVGEGSAQEQAVVGETPNLAARLQQLAEPGMVVIGEATHRLLGNLFEFADLGPLSVRGLDVPVRAFRVLGEGVAESRFQAWHAMEPAPLVGRDPELALLIDRWSLAKSGEGNVVLLSGEAGIGKSRMVIALQERLRSEKHVSLRYYGSPYHANSALHPVIEQLTRAAGFARCDRDETKIEKLEALIARADANVADIAPFFAELLSLSTEGRFAVPSLPPQEKKARTFRALHAQLEGLAVHSPILMVLEDAHWLDPTTLELFDLLVERIERLPVLLVVTYRPEFKPPWTGHAHVTAITLNRLGRKAAEAIIYRHVAGKPLPKELLAEMVAKTDGVPLFVEELTKTVLESGLLREVDDHYELQGPPARLAIPATLHDSLLARLDRLAPVKEVAQIGAAIGRVFAHRLLMAVTRSTEDELLEALHRLIGSELVFRQGDPPDSTYTFKHALVRDAAYESLLKSKRTELHARIAKAIEERFPETVEAEPELLAQHYTEAGLAQPAVDYWLRAGQRAARRSAHHEASAHLRRGITLLGALPDTSDRDRLEIELQSTLGAALVPLKGQAAPEVGEAYARAQDLCERAGLAGKLYPILQGLFHFHAVRAELDRARALAERCHAIACREADPALLLAAHHVMTGHLLWSGEFQASRNHLASALEVEDRAMGQTLPTEIDLRIFLRGFGSHSVWHLGYFEQAIRLSEEAVALARRGRDPFNLALALDYAAMLRQFARDTAAADQLASEAISVCAEHRFAYYLAWATIIHGWAQAMAGSVGEGLSLVRRGLANVERTGARLRRPYYLSLLADVLVRAGRGEEALAALEEALATSGATGERWRDADLHRRREGVLLTMPGWRACDVGVCFTTSLDVARRQNALALELQTALDLARLWVDRGRRHQAYELLAPIYARFTEGFDTPDLIEAKTLLDELGAMLGRSPMAAMAGTPRL